MCRRHAIRPVSVSERRVRAWLRERNEILAAVLLAFSALATAWSSYQASLWGGVQATEYNLSSGLRLSATHAADDAMRYRLLDIALFSQWLQVYVAGRTGLATIYEEHFRPEFSAAFRAWRSLDGTRMRATTPFEQPEYHLQQTRAAEEFSADAAEALQAAQRANHVSDQYVFVTVILALVIFFAGAIRPLVSMPLRGPALLMSALLCAWAVLRIITSPLAR